MVKKTKKHKSNTFEKDFKIAMKKFEDAVNALEDLQENWGIKLAAKNLLESAEEFAFVGKRKRCYFDSFCSDEEIMRKTLKDMKTERDCGFDQIFYALDDLEKATVNLRLKG
ncbi:MAG: hypothetical protein Nk1A_6690 [Endomicrobiia bacterium]|nr:MAG: hypothetical protein Nk1A_6690 [Endomicrobiia bacterium]